MLLSRHPLRSAGVGLLALLAICASTAQDAYAQRVYVYGPPPPPRRRAYYYYEDREPLYALSLALDVEGAIPVNLPRFLDGNNVQGGGGFKARLGEQIRAGYGVSITPEVGYGYDHLFASDAIGNAYSWDMHRAFGGVRLSFGRILVPVVYGHVGYGWRNTGDPTVPQAQGVAWDVGGALDLHLVPRFGFGAFAEYAGIDAQPYAPQWVALGLHANVLF